MADRPYSTALATGVRADSATETYDVTTRGRRGAIVVHDVTVIGNGHAFVDGAVVSLPLTVAAATNDTFKFNTVEYTIAPGTYTTLAALATAVGAALHTATAFSTLVTVAASPAVSGALRFTNVPTGASSLAFAAGTTDVLAALGITAAWTISHTENAGSDGTYSATVTIQGVDPVSGKAYDILSSAAQSTVSTVVLQVGPDLVAVSNAAAAALLPATIRVKVTHTNDDSITRTLGITLVS